MREIAHIEGDKQVAVMRVVDFGYCQAKSVVKQGVPVEWRIDAGEARLGASCWRHGWDSTILSDKATTTVRFTPEAPGEYAFNCSMGMMTPGAKIIVLPKGSYKS